nr:unnamed protein product [Callosobruchus chinensis]
MCSLLSALRAIPVCRAAAHILAARMQKAFPRVEQDWRNISQSFEELWNFPHCLGAIDGKHVSIIPHLEADPTITIIKFS